MQDEPSSIAKREHYVHCAYLKDGHFRCLIDGKPLNTDPLP